MRRLILAVLLLALIIAPLETLGILRRGADQAKEIAGSVEAQTVWEKFKTQLPKVGERVTQFFAKIFPDLEVGVKPVQ